MINTTARILELLDSRGGTELPGRAEARAKRWASNLRRNPEAAARFRTRHAIKADTGAPAHVWPEATIARFNRAHRIPSEVPKGVTEPAAPKVHAPATSDSIASSADREAFKRYSELSSRHPLEAAEFYRQNAQAVLNGRHDAVKASQRKAKAETMMTTFEGNRMHARIFEPQRR